MKIKALFTIIVSFGIMASCCAPKKAPATGKEAYTPEMQKVVNQFPAIAGFEKRVIFLAELPKEETGKRMIEIIPGQQLMADKCNQYRLQGRLVKNVIDKTGYDYYQFHSDGQVSSTRMACPDDEKVSKFVKGESLMVDYKSTLPYVVYTAPTIDVKYALWKASDAKPISAYDNNSSATGEALENLKYYPEKEGYVKHVLYLPQLLKGDEENRKVEIVAGKVLQVDNCNNHRMSGQFTTEVVEGFGYSYWVFDSNGIHLSTRMACPDGTLENRFVGGESTLLRYNSRLPVVVYTPAGFEVNYTIWETNGKVY